jgi:RNA polymerase sigma-70 factor (ECF subfamily)
MPLRCGVVTPELELHAGALMARAQGGDQPAYDELLRLAARDARGFVSRRVGAVDWVEDVVQEALISIHKARHTYDPARPFGPWFYAIVHSRLIDVLRSKKRLGSREVADEAVLAAQPAPRADAAEADVRETLARAVAALPRVQREIVSLLKYEDLSVRDVARRMGMSEAAVKASAHRGYKLLRRTVGLTDVEHRPAD